MLVSLNAWLSGSSYPFQLLLTFPFLAPPFIFQMLFQTSNIPFFLVLAGEMHYKMNEKVN